MYFRVCLPIMSLGLRVVFLALSWTLGIPSAIAISTPSSRSSGTNIDISPKGGHSRALAGGGFSEAHRTKRGALELGSNRTIISRSSSWVRISRRQTSTFRDAMALATSLKRAFGRTQMLQKGLRSFSAAGDFEVEVRERKRVRKNVVSEAS